MYLFDMSVYSELIYVQPFYSGSSRRKKCTQPYSPPATRVRSSGVTAHVLKHQSPLNVTSADPLSRLQTLRVLSHEAEMPRRQWNFTPERE